MASFSQRGRTVSWVLPRIIAPPTEPAAPEPVLVRCGASLEGEHGAVGASWGQGLRAVFLAFQQRLLGAHRGAAARLGVVFAGAVVRRIELCQVSPQ